MNSTMSPTMEVSLAGYIFRLSIMCFCVLLLTKGAGVSSAKKRCVHRGEAIKLFSDIGGQCEEGSMYTENETYIASWSLKDDNIKIEYMNPNCNGRIHMDGNRNIWFLGVERKDAGKYFFKSGVHIKLLDVELTVLEELTEVQVQECPNNCPDFPKKDFGKLTEEQIGQEIQKWLDDHPEFIKKYLVSHKTACSMDRKTGSDHFQSENRTTSYWTIGLQSVTLFILTLYIGHEKKNDISKRLNSWLNWIIARLPCHHWRQRQEPSHKDKNTTVVTIEEPDILTEDRIQRWLYDHPDFMEKNLVKLTDDQIREQIQKWLGVYPMFIEKYLGKLTEDQIGEQIHKWLGVYPGPRFIEKYLETLTEDRVQNWLYDHPDFMEKNLDVHAESSNENQYEDAEHHLPVSTTIDNLDVTLMEPVTGREDNNGQRMSLQENLIIAETCSNPSSDVHVESNNENQEKDVECHIPDTTTLKDLGVTLIKPVTGREDNHRQRMSSEENLIISETCSNPSSDVHVESNNENQEKDVECHIPDTTTLKDLGVTLIEPVTGREDNHRQRMSSEENLIISETCSNPSSGSYNENQYKDGEYQFPGTTTLKDLGITLMEPLTEGEDNHGQRMSSQENRNISETCSNPSSDAKVKLRDQESQLLVLTAESQNLKVADVPRGVSDDAHETVFENEERSGGIEVKDMDYDPDSSTAINESEDPSEKTVSQLATHQAAYFVPIQLPDPEHETEELTTEHQPSAMSETMRELQELRDAALCKICLVNKMSMFFMPCKHIATCGNCSISLQLCPLCRAIIEDKMNICFD